MQNGQVYEKAFDRVLTYIEQNLTVEISLDTLAEIAHISKYHFHRLFKEATGESLSGYIKKRKLSYAARQLVSTQRRIEDIALELDYESAATFSRAFKRQFNVAPGKHRQLNILWPALVLNPIDIKLYINKAPEFQETSLPELTLLGYSFKAHHTAKSTSTDPGWIDQYWNFFSTLHSHKYPVSNARIYNVDRTTLFRRDEKEGFHREYVAFSGVPKLENREPMGLEECVIPAGKYLYMAFKGSAPDLVKYFRRLFETHIPKLPYKINYDYHLYFEDMGLDGQFLDKGGNLDYEAYFDFCSNYNDEKMYYNSPDFVTHFFLPYTEERDSLEDSCY